MRKWPIHHKLLIMDAQIGKRVQQVVYTGSHNFTNNALVRHDEIWTGYRSPFVFNTYVGYFDQPVRPRRALGGSAIAFRGR